MYLLVLSSEADGTGYYQTAYWTRWVTGPIPYDHAYGVLFIGLFVLFRHTTDGESK